MRNYRKTLAGIAAMAMLLNTAPAMIPQAYSMLSVAVSAAEEASIFTYESNGTSITITGVPEDATSVIIPETIDGLPVTAIADGVFLDCRSMETLTLPAAITSFCIDDINMLSDMGILQNVIWQGTLPQWEDATYTVVDGGPDLSAKLQIPADGIVLGVYDTYYRYTAYTEENYTVITGVANVEYELPVTEVVIPDEIDGVPVTVIGNSAFKWQAGITSVTLPESIRTIQPQAFSNCQRLETIVLPSNMLMGSIGDAAFANCYALKSIDFPEYITSIGAQAFFGCTSLTEITYPVAADLSAGVFSGCTSLATVHLPANIEEIPENAFYDCTALTDVYYDDTETAWNAITIDTGNEALDTATIHYAETTQGVHGDLHYENVGGKYVVITGLANDVESVTIPAQIGGVPVTQIGDSAFAGEKYITSVALPNSITSIGDYAFQDCYSLAVCHLPERLYHLGKYAFQNCYFLQTVTAPELLKEIPEGCFNYCLNLTTAVLNRALTTIGAEAFSHCEALTAVHLPKALTSIGDNAFDYCTELDDVYYEGTEEEWNVLYANAGTGNYVFALDTTTIHYGGYEEKTDTGLTYYKYWDHVEILNADPSLTAMEIPAEIDSLPVTAIAASAFEDCVNLQSVTIPDTVTTIGTSAFKGTSLQSVTVPESVTTMHQSVFAGCDSLTDAVIEAPLTVLPHNTFSGCDNLVNVTLPDTITYIGLLAFSNCTSLASVDLPAGLTIIGERAFYNCTSLHAVDLPDTLTNIGSYVFYGCTSMTELNIPASVKEIGWSVTGNSGITAFNVDEANPTYKSVDGVLLNKSGTYIRSYPGGKEGAYTIPDGVLVVDRLAFEDAKGLTSLTISESVVTLVNQSFLNCTALTEVNIPATLEAIYGNVFEGCTALESFNVEESSTYFKEQDGMLIELKKSRLLHCPAAIEGKVVIPEEIVLIGDGAFAGCTGLTEVVIPDSVTTIYNGAFSGCTGLTSVVIPDSVTSILDGAFMDCTNLETAVLPAGETDIADFLFEGCTSLREVTIPASINYVSNYAFYECPSLSVVNYGGTESQWKTVEIMEDGNDALLNVEIRASEGHALGDLDGDGMINTNDAAAILQDAAIEGASGVSNLTDAQKTAADVNNDGVRNATDAAFILHYAAYLGTGGTDSLETYVKNFNQ